MFEIVRQNKINLRMEKGKLGAILVSAVFFILFTSYTGGNTLMSSIYDQKDFRGLGQIMAFAAYSAFCIGVLFAENIVSW